MARRGTHHHLRVIVLLVAVAVAAGLAGGTVADRPDSELAAAVPQSAVTVTPTALEVAVVPARTDVGGGAGVHHSPGRSLLPLVAALTTAAGLLGFTAGRIGSPAGTRRPLLARRHVIALRAPPLLLV